MGMVAAVAIAFRLPSHASRQLQLITQRRDPIYLSRNVLVNYKDIDVDTARGHILGQNK
jgi:hypothetical protein